MLLHHSNQPALGSRPWASLYRWAARASCFRLFAHLVRLAASRTRWTAGNSRAINTAMIAMTTTSSTSVKPSGLRTERTDMANLRGMTFRTAPGDDFSRAAGPAAAGPAVLSPQFAELLFFPQDDVTHRQRDVPSAVPARFLPHNRSRSAGIDPHTGADFVLRAVAGVSKQQV